jgi:hypothetical protein
MSEQKALEILADFANALEAAAVNVKHQIAELQGVAQKGFTRNAEKIIWVEADGTHGKYERLPATLKELIEEYVKFDMHTNASEFTRDALREKLAKDAPELYARLFKEAPKNER